MVGICTLLDRAWALARLGLVAEGGTSRKRPGSCAPSTVSGVAAVVALECGWIVTEVGRQPWVVYGVMRTEDAVTGASGVWITFSAVLVLYVALGVATVVILRTMAHRWRTAEIARRRGALWPQRARAAARTRTAGGKGAMSTADAVAGVLWIGATLYAGVRRGGLGGGVWSLLAGTRRARGARARSDRPGDRAGLGTEPRLAHLRPGSAVDGVLGRLLVDHVDPVHPTQPRGARDRPPGLRVRLPQARPPAPLTGASPSASSGLFSLLTPFFMGTVVGAIASGRVPVGNAAGDAVTSWLNAVSLLTGALFVATGAYLSAVFLVSDARRAGDPDLERYFSTRALIAALATGAIAPPRVFVLRADARFIYDGLTSGGCRS